LLSSCDQGKIVVFACEDGQAKPIEKHKASVDERGREAVKWIGMKVMARG
jgi:hypothetical protein